MFVLLLLLLLLVKKSFYLESLLLQFPMLGGVDLQGQPVIGRRETNVTGELYDEEFRFRIKLLRKIITAWIFPH